MADKMPGWYLYPHTHPLVIADGTLIVINLNFSFSIVALQEISVSIYSSNHGSVH